MTKIKYLYLIITAVSLISCREEIISPDNIAGNINEPVKQNSPSYYSFVINAQNISTDVIDSTPFRAVKSRCYITILGYGSGSVQITIAGPDNNIMYQQIFKADTNNLPVFFEDISPEFIKIKFLDFTGKLRFELIKI